MKRWTCGVSGSFATSSSLGNRRLKQNLTRRPTAGYRGYAGYKLFLFLYNICSCVDTACVFDVQVEYTYPAHTNISDGAKDLVSRLLKHNPMHRLPVQGVLAHPWVVERSTKKPTTVTTEQPSK